LENVLESRMAEILTLYLDVLCGGIAERKEGRR
jgi:hypothetical protein